MATGTTVALQDGFWGVLGAGGASGNTMPPGPVTGLAVMPLDMAASLEWTNPSDIDFAGTLILYSTVDFPATVSDRTPVENGSRGVFDGAPGSDGDFEHSALTNGTTYYYTAFAFDSTGNYAAGAVDSTTPYDGVPPGQVTVDAVEAGDGFIELRWTNPDDTDFVGSLVRYSTVGYPASETDGTVVPNGANGRFGAASATPYDEIDPVLSISVFQNPYIINHLDVYLVARLVRDLLDSSVIPGRRRVQWDGCDGNGHGVASGVYFYRVTYEAKTVTKKIVHLR